MNFKDLKTLINKKKVPNVIVLTGTEYAVRDKYINMIPTLHRRRIEKLEELVKHSRSKSLVKASFQFVMKNNKEILKYSLDEVKNLVGNTHTLILCYDAPDSRTKLLKSAKGVTYAFDRINNSEQYVSQLMPDVDFDMACYIADKCADSIGKIEMECDKLLALNRPITYDDIDDLIVQTPENKIWDFLDDIVTGDINSAFQKYRELKELKESEVKFVSLLFRAFKTLIEIQILAQEEKLTTDKISKITSHTTWQINKTMKLVGKVDTSRLIRNLGLSHKLELDIKTGRVPAELGFKTYLTEVCRG